MRSAHKTIRQSVSLPADVATQVRTMAKSRRLSANRLLVELIENGIEAEKRKQQDFLDLAVRFRAATDREEVWAINWAAWSSVDAPDRKLGQNTARCSSTLN